MFETITSHSCKVMSTGKLTYWPTDRNKVPDVIDYYICKGIGSNYTELKNIEDLTSGHVQYSLD